MCEKKCPHDAIHVVGFHAVTDYSKCTNFNSVSIELCSSTDKEAYSKEQAAAIKRLIKYIRKYCPNANTVIRHFDVNGKHCPAPMMNEKVWKKFKKAIGE